MEVRSILQLNAAAPALLRAALVFIALSSPMLFQSQACCVWKFSHALYDYEFGFVKRGLLGELLNGLFPVLSVPLFKAIFVPLYVALFAVTAGLLQFLPTQTGVLSAILLATSPFMFRNVIYDWGRFDVFGLLMVAILGLAVAANWRPRAILYVIAPSMLLFHEVNAFIMGGFYAAVIWLFETRRLFKLGLFVASLAAWTGVILLFGQLDVPPDVMLDYMRSKTLDRFSDTTYILTSTIGSTVVSTIPEVIERTQSENFLYKLFVLCTFLVTIVSAIGPSRELIGGILLVAGSCLPLYVLGFDVFRWLALQGLLCFLFVLLFVQQRNLEMDPRRLALIIWPAAILLPVFGISVAG